MLGVTSVSTGLGGDHHVSGSSHHRQSFAATKLGEFADVNAVRLIESRGSPPWGTIVVRPFDIAVGALTKICDV